MRELNGDDKIGVMTIRENFASIILQAIISHTGGGYDTGSAVKLSVKLADELIKELNNIPTKTPIDLWVFSYLSDIDILKYKAEGYSGGRRLRNVLLATHHNKYYLFIEELTNINEFLKQRNAGRMLWNLFSYIISQK